MPIIGIFIALLIITHILHKVYAKACLKNLDIQLSVSATTATEGDTLTLTEVLANNKWLPLPWVAVKFFMGRELQFASSAAVTDAYYRNDLFHILMHQKITRRLAFTCTKRGYYTIDKIDLTSWDVLMISKYAQKYPCNVHLTVLPSTIPTDEIDGICTHVYGYLRTSIPIHPDPFSFRGIREYSSTDTMKAINFKASARGMGLMSNVWDFANARQVVILLDTQRHIHLHSEHLEEYAIKLVASIAEKMTAMGTPISFATNAKSVALPERVACDIAPIPEGLGTQHTYAILEALAYIDLNNQDMKPFAQILDDATTSGRLESEYWIITAYYAKEVEAAYLRLKASGARVVWITPDRKPMDIDVCEDIFFIE